MGTYGSRPAWERKRPSAAPRGLGGLADPKHHARRKEAIFIKFKYKDPNLKGVYFNAKELRAITLVPRSTVYRIMDKCRSRTLRYDIENKLILCVEWTDFLDTLKAQTRGNPRFRSDSSFQRENSARRWRANRTHRALSQIGIDSDTEPE